ncbi:hypothetical protein [Vogesella indigofera]|uniref:hypothetical protein n=1 Tax=Vogesella indigofera TaxID=45465 RepID=UPI00234E4FF3|nr:hypothetical protein [Vogesella indigofera]MDC7707726.1 hypothetical protein [Vogesella indigofera]
MHWSFYWAVVIVTFVLGWYCTEKNLQDKGKGTVQRVLGAWFTTSFFAAVQIVLFLIDNTWLDIIGLLIGAIVISSFFGRIKKPKAA